MIAAQVFEPIAHESVVQAVVDKIETMIVEGVLKGGARQIRLLVLDIVKDSRRYMEQAHADRPKHRPEAKWTTPGFQPANSGISRRFRS